MPKLIARQPIEMQRRDHGGEMFKRLCLLSTIHTRNWFDKDCWVVTAAYVEFVPGNDVRAIPSA